MKRFTLIVLMALGALSSCTMDETRTIPGPLPEELLGIWAPESGEPGCDRYILFESGQCYTYISQTFMPIRQGYIYLSDGYFTLMDASYCHLTDSNPAHLILRGKDAGPLLLLEEPRLGEQTLETVLVINQERYHRIKGIMEDSHIEFDKVVFDKEQFDPSIPDKKVLLTEVGKPVYLSYKLYATGESAPIAPNEAAKWVECISMDESIATIDMNDRITPRRNGEVVIKIHTYNSRCTDICHLVIGGGDLSKDKPANCYITNSPGQYCFKALKGNQKDTPIRNINDVVVKWETVNSPEAPEEGSIIREVRLSENKDSIYFKIPYPMKDGNALIAAVDAGNTILWSWHIWSCKDFDAVNTAQVYLNNAGTLMDRNLGALSAEPGQMGSAGLLYQWGRKDPFPGATQVAPARNILRAKTTHDDDWEYVVGIIPPEYAAKPMRFCRASNGYEWAESNLNFWNEEKTCYDPCPPGWKVANANVLTKALTDAVEYKSASLLEWPKLESYYAFDLGRKVSTASHVYYPMTACIFVPAADGTPFYSMTDFSRIWCNKRVDNASTAQSICLNFTDDQVPNKIGLYWNAPGGKLRDEDIHYCGKACGNAVRCMME